MLYHTLYPKLWRLFSTIPTPKTLSPAALQNSVLWFKDFNPNDQLRMYHTNCTKKQLVGGWAYPSEKWWSSSVGMMTLPIYGKKTGSKPPHFFPHFRTVRMLSSKAPTRQCQMFVLHLANSFMLSSRTKTRLGETHFCRWWNPNASTSSGSGSDTWW